MPFVIFGIMELFLIKSCSIDPRDFNELGARGGNWCRTPSLPFISYHIIASFLQISDEFYNGISKERKIDPQ